MMDYNKNVRPVKNASDALIVKFGANLCRLIDVVSFLFFCFFQSFSPYLQFDAKTFECKCKLLIILNFQVFRTSLFSSIHPLIMIILNYNKAVALMFGMFLTIIYIC